MGENVYKVRGKMIKFSESDDSFCCLCTFPHNDDEQILPHRAKSLAVFGAVVQLVLKGYYDGYDGEYIFIPHDVPDWVVRDIEKLFPDEEVQ